MQRDLTLITEISGDCAALMTLLRQSGDQMQAGWQNNAASPLDAVQPLHFLSLFVIEPQAGNPALLVLEASFDDYSRDQFIDELVRTNGALLRTAYAYCTRCPQNPDDEQLRGFLKRQKHRNQLFYVGCPGLTTRRVLEEARVAADVEAAVQGINRPSGRRAQIVRQIFQSLSSPSRQLILDTPDRPYWVRHPLYEQPVQTLYWYVKWPLAIAGWAMFVFALINAFRPEWLPPRCRLPVFVLDATVCWLAFFFIAAGLLTLIWALIWAHEFPARLTSRLRWYVILTKLGEYVRTTLHALPGFAAVLGLLALAHWQWQLLWTLFLWGLGILVLALLVAAVIWFVRLLRIGLQEMSEGPFDLRWDPARLSALREREDRLAQTHIISVTSIRPGLLRMTTLRCVLFAIHWLARIFYNPLGLFSTQSIHFARWTIIDGRRLLFISNYDGGFGGYLGIFATLGATGVSAIWTNTEGFPRGFLLFGDGARDEQPFKARARNSQIESLFWYRRYPRLSVAAIERNAAIRKELAHFSAQSFQVPEAAFDVFLRRFATATP